MSWKCFKLEYELKSPIHIGYGSKLGIVDRTRYYVPGKTFWGAVTAKLGKNMGLKNNNDWINLSNLVRENLIFSYFYIKDDEFLIPEYTENGLKFGNLTPEEFEHKYITSYASTAIDKNKGSAEDGSLHEIELISNKIRKNNKFVTVRIGGFLFVREKKLENNQYNVILENNKIKIENSSKKIKNLFEVIKNLQVGGERNYGYGKIKLEEGSPENSEEDEVEIFNNQKVNLKTDSLEIKIDKGEKLTTSGHLLVSKPERKNKEHFDKLKDIQGDFEPLVGREWSDDKGPGQKTNFGGIALKPGSKFKLNNDNIKITISDYGVWKFEKLKNNGGKN